jgi:glutathione S-transferase
MRRPAQGDAHMGGPLFKLEAHLTTAPFFSGPRASVADIALYPDTASVPEG